MNSLFCFTGYYWMELNGGPQLNSEHKYALVTRWYPPAYPNHWYLPKMGFREITKSFTRPICNVDRCVFLAFEIEVEIFCFRIKLHKFFAPIGPKTLRLSLNIMAIAALEWLWSVLTIRKSVFEILPSFIKVTIIKLYKR